ncbi:MAG: ADP-ribosylglycohydrolase family protein [Methanocalculaceae archaeon]|jgi:ADP-ribosylglycohydrolase|nr:ADP-ribosylglycohydrolase family protein [Methanocalculaceae archaeon]
MLDKYKGCLLGAVLGDALGMPSETTVSRFIGATLGFKRAYKGHPNHDLLPGQYTDDSQLILIASRLLAEANWGPEPYAKELLRTYTLNKFRYPDGTIYAACKRMKNTGDLTGSGVSSDSAGCVSLAVPFALVYKDRREMAPKLLEACNITHTHTGTGAAAIGVALMLNTLIETGNTDDAYLALLTAAQNMNPDLASRINNAVRIERTGMQITDALAAIGNSSSIYHTLPLAIFLCKRYSVPEELLTSAAACGGNADTLTLLCGAFSGARYGISSLPQELLAKLERRGEFEALAEKFIDPKKPEIPAAAETPNQKPSKSPESIYDAGWEPE